MPVINKRMDRGDTLIEVLFAIAVFSLVAVSSLSIMNQGMATAQRALEITLVRQEINAQAETLRFLNASYIQAYKLGSSSYSGQAGEWSKIRSRALSTTTISDLGECTPPPNSSFILNTRKAEYVSPTVPGRPVAVDMLPQSTFSQVVYDTNNVVTSAQGIWIEAIGSESSTDPNEANAGYIDFHIRACWDSPGQSMPVTLGTIVRLYEPRG